MKNVEKLMGMITQLLELQKTELHAEECLKVSPYDIKAYLEENVAEFHLAAMQKSVGIELEVEPDMPKVWMTGRRWIHIHRQSALQCLEVYREGSHLIYW